MTIGTEQIARFKPGENLPSTPPSPATSSPATS
jgi:hypothetical protein